MMNLLLSQSIGGNVFSRRSYQFYSISTKYIHLNSIRMFCSRFGHNYPNEKLFKSYDNRHTNRSQRGLYHGKTHAHKFKVWFSDKRHRITQYPNYHKMRFNSDILKMKVRLPTTAYALKNIVKAGSFDNYILNTDPKKMNSKMGIFLKDIMKQKLKDPTYKVPYIPFSAVVKKRTRRRPKYMLNLPSIYVPLHVRQNVDVSKYHLKKPDEYTREEMAEIQKAFKDPDSFQNASYEWKSKQPHFIEVRKEMLALQPMRHKFIQQYLEKNKNNPIGRKYIMDMADSTEDFPKWILGDDYVNYRSVLDPALTATPELGEKDAIKIKDSLRDMDPDSELRKTKEEELKKIAMTTIQLKIGEKVIDFNPFEHKALDKKERIINIKKEFKA